jgi:hypothetical protein
VPVTGIGVSIGNEVRFLPVKRKDAQIVHGIGCREEKNQIFRSGNLLEEKIIFLLYESLKTNSGIRKDDCQGA